VSPFEGLHFLQIVVLELVLQCLELLHVVSLAISQVASQPLPLLFELEDLVIAFSGDSLQLGGKVRHLVFSSF
jgi:hypothetical protein